MATKKDSQADETPGRVSDATVSKIRVFRDGEKIADVDPGVERYEDYNATSGASYTVASVDVLGRVSEPSPAVVRAV